MKNKYFGWIEQYLKREFDSMSRWIKKRERVFNVLYELL